MSQRTQDIPLEDISLHKDCQMRVAMSEDAIADYMGNIDKLPPSKVMLDEDGKFWLYAGWHRYTASTRAKKPTLKCHVAKGSLEDAILAAAGENHDHGLRRTNDDKRRAVTVLLGHAQWAKQSDRWIADQCNVSHPFVATIRASSIQDSTGNVTTPDDEEPKRLCPKCKKFGWEPTCLSCRELNPKTRSKPTLKTDELTDACGATVPNKLRDLFGDNWLKQILAMIDESILVLDPDAMKKKLKGKSLAYAKWLRAGDAMDQLDAAYAAISVLRETIEAGVPFAVCPGCQGSACDKCRATGWMPRARFEEMEGD